MDNEVQDKKAELGIVINNYLTGSLVVCIAIIGYFVDQNLTEIKENVTEIRSVVFNSQTSIAVNKHVAEENTRRIHDIEVAMRRN